MADWRQVFLGFKPLLPALSKVGASDQAYKLILSTEYPSLGYEIVNGATSIWERWDSYIKGKGFVHNAAMNSFSHYAFGSVNEWMFENILGIKSLENGYRKIVVRPEIGQNGIKKSEWELPFYKWTYTICLGNPRRACCTRGRYPCEHECPVLREGGLTERYSS